MEECTTSTTRDNEDDARPCLTLPLLHSHNFFTQSASPMHLRSFITQKIVMVPHLLLCVLSGNSRCCISSLLTLCSARHPSVRTQLFAHTLRGLVLRCPIRQFRRCSASSAPDNDLKFAQSLFSCPIAFKDEPSGFIHSFALSALCGEASLFVMEFATNQRANGLLLYRIHDDFWF